MLPPSGKITAHGSVEGLPKSSPLIKLAILPRKIPIGATQAIISVRLNKLIFLFCEKINVEIITPSKPPWNDIPPYQIIKISKGFWR